MVFDSPLGYVHAETVGLIDFMVFIDTPLEVAMARRLLRTVARARPGDTDRTIDSVRSELTAYLEYGRRAYFELDKQVKPGCDLVLDGCCSTDDLARQIVDAITPSGL